MKQLLAALAVLASGAFTQDFEGELQQEQFLKPQQPQLLLWDETVDEPPQPQDVPLNLFLGMMAMNPPALKGNQ